MTGEQIYQQAIANGCSPRLAEMLAERRAPRANTDREFFVDQRKLADQFGNDNVLHYYVNTARKHGGDPGQNDVYISQLARFPGDPEAFVPPSGGRTHIKRVLEQRGWGCSGAVNVQRQEVEPEDYTPGLAPDIVESYVDDEIRLNPDNATKPRQQLREQVIEKFSPQA